MDFYETGFGIGTVAAIPPVVVMNGALHTMQSH